jgi:hypothetical protein
MASGLGKYDDACTVARLATDAEAVILIVLGGNKGSGFSVQSLGAEMTAKLPALLRSVAAQIENSLP